MASVAKIIRPYKHILVYSAILCASGLTLFLGIIPAFRATTTLYSELRELSVKVTALRGKLTMLQSLDEESLRNQLGSLITGIPQHKSLPTVFTTLESIGAQSGVTLTEMSFAVAGPLATQAASRQTVEEKKLGASLLPFSVSAEGQLTQMRDFLALVVGVRRILRIRTATLITPVDAVVKARLDIDAFFAPFPAAIAQSAEKLEPLSAKDEEMLAKVGAIPVAGQPESDVPSLTTLPTKNDPFSP